MDLPESLLEFGTDLTQSAREGKLAPLIGRESVLGRLMEILGRAAKNNPVLVGDAGVGKTAIVEGLAQVMVSSSCPSWLRGKALLALDLAAIVAGTRNRGDFEARLKALVDVIRAERGRIIVFIDEIHLLINLGKNDASVDAANFLKPMLARGEFRCVGATTFDEFRQIEKDPALTRRFLVVRVDEPAEEETLAILRGLRHRYERFHGVRIQDEALASAIRLSTRYLADRRQPDIAIDLVDEACAFLRSGLELPPAAVRETDSLLNQLRVQESGLRREGGDVLVRVRSEIRRLERERTTALRAWETICAQRKQLGEVLAHRDRLTEEIDAFEKELDLKRVVELRAQLAAVQSEAARLQSAVALPEVTGELVAEVVARATGIEVAKVRTDVSERLRRLEASLNERIIGQQVAIAALVSGIARSYAGLNNPQRPLLSVLLTGEHGAGKTALARALADELCDGAIAAVDMAEYSERGAVARLIGAPPGYVGFEQGGQLTEKVRRRPYCVVLFDNLERGHGEVLQLIQSILEEGAITDSSGRPVSFRHCVVVLTTTSPGLSSQPAVPESRAEVHTNFERRVNLALRLQSLDIAAQHRLIRSLLDRLNHRLAGRVQVTLNDEVVPWLIRHADDGNARSLIARFQDRIEPVLAKAMLDPSPRQNVGFVVADGEIAVQSECSDR